MPLHRQQQSTSLSDVVHSSDDNIHGLDHSPEFLSSLPVLLPRPSPHQPIRTLGPEQFSHIHLRHLTAHAPDSILFPYLHGLEGDNDAQNLFFATAGAQVKIPKYRGLVWVVCDEDLGPSVHFLPGTVERQRNTRDFDEPDELDDECYSSSSSGSEFADCDKDDLDAFAMDIDSIDAADQRLELDRDDTHEVHMHPVNHRSISQPTKPQISKIDTNSHNSNIIYSSDYMNIHDRRSSNASTTSSAISMSASASSALSSSTSATSFFPSPTPTSSCPSPATSYASSFPVASKSDIETVSPTPPVFTSTFRPKDLLRTTEDGQPEFIPLAVPEGISLRNFGIQVPLYATLCDIVVYSPKGITRAATAVAEKFKLAIERKAHERVRRFFPEHAGPISEQEFNQTGILPYNVFVLAATAEDIHNKLGHLIARVEGDFDKDKSSHTTAHTDGPDGHATSAVNPSRANTIDFAQREKDEMRDLTKATEIISVLASDTDTDEFSGTTTATRWDPTVGQVFLGNSSDVPIAPELPVPTSRSRASRTGPVSADVNADLDPFDYSTNDPEQGLGYDICVECHDLAPFPNAAHLRAAEEHLRMLDKVWDERCHAMDEAKRTGEAPTNDDTKLSGRVRPPPNANAVIHLPFPSSPPSTAASVVALMPAMRFLERCLQPVPPPPAMQNDIPNGSEHEAVNDNGSAHSRRWGSVSSLMPSFPGSPGHFNSNSRSRSSTSPLPTLSNNGTLSAQRTRPLKILIYSSDGYTESSVPALCMLMAVCNLTLPEAYLELQVVKKRSFFVYQGDLGVLRRVESRLVSERVPNGVVHGPKSFGRAGWGLGKYKSTRPAHAGYPPYANGNMGSGTPGHTYSNVIGPGRPPSASVSVGTSVASTPLATPSSSPPSTPGSSVSSEAHFPPPPMVVPSQASVAVSMPLVKARPRATTSPWLPSLFEDHQSWFADPRFDGSFPSRVLPFLYLGNLNHASNAYMLHALGITHVVSVGECALVPPPHHNPSSSCQAPSPGAHFIAGKGPGGQGSLWIEEREGRIKVLDIKGVCDDGIDTLEPQLEPICDWIEKARAEGGQVLVHCRVGVSRSATVTIAYVMKHLGLPLVDAYLIVRSRRLSVLIQPNMRLLYNLCGWEVKLARERAGDNEERLREELAKTLNWPYLAREVHLLNEKYLHC